MDAPHGFAANWPTHLVSKRGGFCMWYIEPATIVTQALVDVAELSFAEEMVVLVDAMRWGRHERIRSEGGAHLFHDWTRIKKVHGNARAHIGSSWKANVEKGDLRRVLTAMPVNSMIKMGFAVVNIAASFVGDKIENRLIDDVTPFVLELGKAPDPKEDLTEERDLVERRDRGEPAVPLPPHRRSTRTG